MFPHKLFQHGTRIFAVFEILAALAVLAIAVTGSALGAAGQLDPTFAGTGARLLTEQQNIVYPRSFAVQPDNKILLAGYGVSSGYVDKQFLYRMHANGTVDSSFAGTGRIEPLTLFMDEVVVQSDGKILVVGGDRALDLLRYNADGTPDLTFGGNGKIATTFSGGASASGKSVAQQPDGKLLIGGNVVLFALGPRIALVRLNLDGSPDASFGSGGKVAHGPVDAYFTLTSMGLLPDGKIVVAGIAAATPGDMRWALARFNPDGTPDNSFGTGGFAIHDLHLGFALLRRIALMPDGRIVAIGTAGSKAAMMRFNPDGTPDATFGIGGKLVPLSNDMDSRSVAVQPDGRILVSVFRPETLHVMRRLINGDADPSFVMPTSLNLGGDRVDTWGIALQPDGKVLFAGSIWTGDKADIGVGRLQGDEVPGTVVEFFNTILQHYFVTASAPEQMSIDGGGSGPGWIRTGLSFKSGGNSRVCRFYGTTGIGPNSHFHSVEAAECGEVKFDPGWHFEGYDFSSSPPVAPGACPAGTIPVYRAYSNRFAFNDSNHRQTTSLSAYNATVASGWLGEGVVMCAPA